MSPPLTAGTYIHSVTSTSNPDFREAGIGLRAPHYQDMLAAQPALPFLEVHSENFFGDGGQPLQYLTRFREDYAISTHGVGLSLGSADPLNRDHLRRLKRLVERVDPFLVSEHLCWVGVDGRYLNDLLPLPYTEESLDHVVRRIGEVQEALRRRILVENVSSYLEFVESTIPEWEFVAEVSRRAGCGILLDVNNIYVNACNHGFDARAYIDAIPAAAVGEIHLAGFQDTGQMLIDTHGAAVCEDVWDLYAYALTRTGVLPTLIEWDTDIPALGVLLGEAQKAGAILKSAAAKVPRAA
jgi:uncharacterized protein (UPF0276 family)